ALPVGLLVLGIGISLGGPTGYAMSPARDLSPRIMHALLPIPGKRDSDWRYAWVPVVGPLLGGAAAAGLPRAGIVHRLDKETSGLMVVARTLAAQTDLVRQLQARTVKRRYFALVWGTMPEAGTIDAPIGRDPRERTRMAVVTGASGKPARTHFRTVDTCLWQRQPVSAIQCDLE
ncbi:pseudouridine synthase, partial [Bacillus velezensis]|nr:pseudouridine synthase [Bacillus velezensis]